MQGPTQTEVTAAHKAAVRKLAHEVAKAANRAPPYFGGRGNDYSGHVGDVVIRSRLIRASNGEACLWATATSPKGSILEAPWMPGGCTATAVIRSLL